MHAYILIIIVRYFKRVHLERRVNFNVDVVHLQREKKRKQVLAQVHFTSNRVKGICGMIGLTKNTSLLKRWIVHDPDISRVVGQFNDEDEYDEELPHHEEGYTYQHQFQAAET